MGNVTGGNYPAPADNKPTKNDAPAKTAKTK